MAHVVSIHTLPLISELRGRGFAPRIAVPFASVVVRHHIAVDTFCAATYRILRANERVYLFRHRISSFAPVRFFGFLRRLMVEMTRIELVSANIRFGLTSRRNHSHPHFAMPTVPRPR